MALTKNDIEEFKRLYKEHYGEELNDFVAYEAANRLVNMIKLIYKPIPKAYEELYDKLKEEHGAVPKNKKIDYVKHLVEDAKITEIKNKIGEKKFWDLVMKSKNMEKNVKIKTVVFDADGVVINSPDYFSIQYEKEFGVSNDIIQPFFKGRFNDCVVGKADLKEELILLLDDWKWKGTPEELMKYWFKAEHYIDERIVNEIEMLRKRDIKCYLGTQQEKYRMEYIKKDMGFEIIFDKIYSSCDIGYEKSEKQFFEYIVNDLNRNDKIKPEEIMFWDDKQSIVNVAKELGWQAYLYTNFDDFHKIISQIYA